MVRCAKCGKVLGQKEGEPVEMAMARERWVTYGDSEGNEWLLCPECALEMFSHAIMSLLRQRKRKSRW